MEIKELEMIELLKRIVPEIEIKITSAIKENNTIGNKYNRSKFYEEAREGGEQSDFPITISSYDNYRKLANDKQYANFISDMNLTNFYKICQYTGVSADYYLGFRATKRKELSAPIIKEEFGLSDKSMEMIKETTNREQRLKGELNSDLFNFILENKTFWDDFRYLIPQYYAAYHARASSHDIDYITYTLSKTFERLIDDINNHLFFANDGSKESMNESQEKQQEI